MYSWHKPNNTCKSRIDYWLVVEALAGYVSDLLISNKWEFLKYKIRESSIKFSKELIKEKRKKEGCLFQEISKYCEKVELNGDDKEKSLILQTKLDDMYCKRAQGAFVRSRAKWIEKGNRIPRISVV